MLTVRTSFGSPFGRKARIAVSVLGLDGKVKVESATTTDPSDPLRKQNPLGKIPALILADGGALYDSRVIIEYLDQLTGGGRLIPPGLRRFDVLRMQAMADGAMDAALLQVYEVRMRPEEIRSASWTSYQAEKVTRVLAVLEAGPGGLQSRARRRPDRGGLPARLSRPAFCRGLARDPSQAGGMALRILRGGAGLRGDKDAVRRRPARFRDGDLADDSCLRRAVPIGIAADAGHAGVCLR